MLNLSPLTTGVCLTSCSRSKVGSIFSHDARTAAPLLLNCIPNYGKRKLLVDDEPDITFTLQRGLEESEMFEVDAFNDPQMALSSFKPDYYDFMLIDIRMPKINGYELYDKLRSIDSKVKFCFITGYEIKYKALREQFLSIKMETDKKNK